jgi:hypothetical protein
LQSVKTTEFGGPRGYDAGKKIKGRKRGLVTDTIGLPVAVAVHPVDIQDRDGAVPLLTSMRGPWPRHVFADGGYAGDKLVNALIGGRQKISRQASRAPRRGCSLPASSYLCDGWPDCDQFRLLQLTGSWMSYSNTTQRCHA